MYKQMSDNKAPNIKEVLKQYQDLNDRVSKKDFKPTVGDRKTLQNLYSSYQAVVSDDATLLEDVNKLQGLLQNVQGIIR